MSLIDDKTVFFDDLLASYERDFAAFSTSLKRLLAEFIKSGPHTAAEVDAFVKGGMNGVAQNFVSKYDDVIEYTRMVSKQSGIPLVLPDRSSALLALYKDNQIDAIVNAAGAINKGVVEASFRYGLEESSLNSVIKELSAVIDSTGRRIISEAVTGASMYDRTIKFEQFRHADIELYFYDGPYDEVTRDACRATLQDPRQAKGWTMAEIQSSETPFITCGGYNCRHEWLPFVDGLDDLIKDMQKDAGIDFNIPE